ncbi:MAG: hypothetical protein AB8C46_03525 [Burkholderiaceae bacterium]
MKTLPMPSNDLAFGSYPQRVVSRPPPIWETLIGFMTSRPNPNASLPAAFTAEFDRETIKNVALTVDQLFARLQLVGVQLRSDGLSPLLAGRAAATIAELMFRELGLRPYPQQVVAAWHLLNGTLVEMQTGEGKSLAAGLAATMAACSGTPVFILTANDYLVTRDEALLSDLFAKMGLTSSVVTHDTPAPERASRWRADIVYSTARELGFDYLRDYAQTRGKRDPAHQRASLIAGSDEAASPALPGLCFCLVDEADALLLDEAGVPLILAVQNGCLNASAYRKAFAAAESLRLGRDFKLDRQRKRARLTEQGIARVELTLGQRDGVLSLWQRALELVETALCAQTLYLRDQHYAVLNDEVALIDEFTGRISAGRQWQGALQSMVEIKEGVDPKGPTRVTAQITFQALFPRFIRLSGMSGTVADSHRELKTAYGLPVARVPLRKPSANLDRGRNVVATVEQKLAAAVQAIRCDQNAGRPVLVATDSVADSTRLSQRLSREGITHQVLNALDCVDEAATIERAGRASVVTVTTNLAGRGTDIRLTEIARRNGGLSVIATMANRSRRIDLQLFGRAGRQGDPGSYQSIVSLQDRLLADTLSKPLIKAFQGFHRLSRGRPRNVFRALVRLCQCLQQWRDQSARTGLRRLSRDRATQLGFTGLAE